MPRMRTLCFLPQQTATRDDSGATKGARAGGEAGVAAEGPTRLAAGGGGGGGAIGLQIL
jgi:hypothetical protein